MCRGGFLMTQVKLEFVEEEWQGAADRWCGDAVFIVQ